MADHDVERYGNKDHTHRALSNSNIRESDFQYHAQWMAHWMKASGTSTIQGHEHCTLFDADSKEEHIKEQQCFSVEDTKARKAKLFNNDMNLGNSSSYRNLMRSNLSEVNLTSDVHENSDAYNIVREGKVSAEMSHFPLFGINGKIESILYHTRKSKYGTVANRLSEPQLPRAGGTLSPHLLEFALEEHQFRTRRIPQSADHRIKPYKSFKGLPPFQDGLGKLDSHSGVSRFELNRPNMRPCLYSREPNVPSSSEHVSDDYDQHLEDDTLTNSRHGPRKWSSHSTFMVSEMRDNNAMFASSFKSSWSTMKGGSVPVIRDSSLDDFPLPFLAREQDDELVNVSRIKSLPSNKSSQGLTRLNDLGCAHHTLQETSYCSYGDLETPRVLTTSNSLKERKDRCQNFSNTAAKFFMAKNMSKDLSHEEQKILNSADSAKVKESAFFEMLPLSTMPWYQRKHFVESQPLINSTMSENREDAIGTETRFRESQNNSSVKTGMMYIDVQQTPSTSEGVTSSRVQKNVMNSKPPKSNSAATSAYKQVVSRETNTGLPHVAIDQFISSDRAACIGDRELSTSRTESMDANHILSAPMMRNNSTSGTPEETPICSERSSRWEKRLRLNPFDSFSLDAKRYKINNGQSNGEVCNLFSRVFNYRNSGSDMSKCLKGKQIFDETMLLPNNGEQPSRVTVKEMHSWIRRWCHNSPQTVRHQAEKATPVLCEPENSKAVSENIEGKQCASIAAMALMGKMMNNYRPCVFQRRGASVVWKT